jgi:hypothetical protein
VIFSVAVIFSAKNQKLNNTRSEIAPTVPKIIFFGKATEKAFTVAYPNVPGLLSKMALEIGRG